MRLGLPRFLICVAFTGLGVLSAQDIRTVNGAGNNRALPEMGAAHSKLNSLAGYFFEDGVEEPAGSTRPNPRLISNELFAQNGEFLPNERNLSDLIWVFGQFLDHDITLVEDSRSEVMFIPVPECDEFLDPDCTGRAGIPQNRSAFAEGTGEITAREYENAITHWIDGSAVYGSDSSTMTWLRTYEDGKLHVSEFNLLPFNTLDKEINGQPDPNAPTLENPLMEEVPINLMVAGDPRINENLFLAAMHNLFHVEHNLLCDEILAENPQLSDEEVFQRARRLVGAKIQAITYYEWLPAFGVRLSPYAGYDATVDARISNEFSAAAFRFGHNFLNNRLRRMNDLCESINIGDVQLRDVFFGTSMLYETGIDPVIKGMVSQAAQEFDTKVIDDVRNFLFVNNPRSPLGLDLVALNINRGRERGVVDYNTMRRILGLAPVQSFSEITSDADRSGVLSSLYESVEDIDLWVGLLSEDHLADAAIGETLQLIIADQFARLRDGDRFYFENDPAFTAVEVNELKSTTMADIISRNTSILVQDDAFFNDPICMAQLPADNTDFMDITVSPNPIQEDMNVTVFMREDCLAEFRVYDAYGHVLTSESKDMLEGYTTFDMYIDSQLPAGMYFLELRAEENVKVCKVLKVD